VTALNCRAVVWLPAPSQAGSPQPKHLLGSGQPLWLGGNSSTRRVSEHLCRRAVVQVLGTSEVIWPYMKWELELLGWQSRRPQPFSRTFESSVKCGHHRET